MSTHALTTIFSMDPAKKTKLIEDLEPVVIRMVRELPGFVSGTWTWDHETNVSYGFIVFDTDAHARDLERYLRGHAEDLAKHGTRLERAAVGEVIGTASGRG